MAVTILGLHEEAGQLYSRAERWATIIDEPNYWGDRMECQILLSELRNLMADEL